MRLLNVKNHKLSEYFEPDIPPYAILSHGWEAEEVTYVDLHGPDWKQKAGAQKILSACRQACADDLAWIWIDTCCINKSSSAELSEAINSMFRWYAECKICYAFLSDVVLSKVNLVTTAEHEDLSFSPYRVQFLKSAWFTRGWTLQEMIAPDNVEFFCRDWFCIGTRRSLAAYITQACGVDTELLDRNPFHRDIFRRDDFDSIETALQKYSIAQKMSWAAMRQTSRVEDRAYSFLGLLPCTTEGSPWQFGEFYPEHCWSFANITFDFSKFDDRLDTSSALSLSHGSKMRPDPYLKEMIRKGKWGAIALSNEEHGEFAIHFLHIPSAIDGAYKKLLFKISEYNSSNFAKFPSALAESAIEFAESRTDVLQRQNSILTAKGQLILKCSSVADMQKSRKIASLPFRRNHFMRCPEFLIAQNGGTWETD